MQISHRTQHVNYDSEFCGSIPLHLVNLIQPHGILMVLDKSMERIVQASENTEHLLGISVQELISQPLSTYLATQQIEQIKSKLETWNVKDRILFRLYMHTPAKQVAFDITIYSKDTYIMMELELVNEAEKQASFMQFYQEIKYIMTALKEAQDTETIGKIAVTEIKKLSGFDHVLLYHFDSTWNGTVLAEAREDFMDAYLHLWFPASDVPKSARELYVKNPYRLIPDCNFVPAKLIPVLNPLTRAFTDLSDSLLRSVPAVHIEYLKNMHITASMSIPIVINNQLWGLISCHHRTAQYPSYEMRAAFELLSNVIAVQIAAKENEKKILNNASINRIHTRLLEQMYANSSFVDGLLIKSPNVKDLFQATGVAIVYAGELKTIGKVPSSEQIKELIRWLQMQRIEKVFGTDNLPGLFTKSAEYTDSGSGLLVLPISSRKGEFILGFRPEVVQTIEWGGNPNERIQVEADGSSYHPRNSFATWKEIVKNTSVAWSEEELEAAETLRIAILEKILADKL